MVVPKKHARRAVTRNLIKREMRAVMSAMDSAGASLPAGLWVLRLKAPFDRKTFASPASAQLLQAARDELLLLLQRAAAQRR
jgi:ribonuclease P protein component